MPFFAIIVISFMEFRGPVMQTNLSLNNFRDLLDQSSRPLINTLALSTAAAIVAAVIGVPIGFAITRFRSRISDLLDVIAMTPFAVAGTVLAIGLIISFNSGWLVLTGGWLILVLAWVVRKIPFNVRAVGRHPASDRSQPRGGIDQSRRLAADDFRTPDPATDDGWRDRRHGADLGHGRVRAQSSTVVLYSGPWATMTVVMFQALEGTGAGIASAAATVLIVFTVLPVALVYRLLRRHELGMM